MRKSREMDGCFEEVAVFSALGYCYAQSSVPILCRICTKLRYIYIGGAGLIKYFFHDKKLNS